MSFPFFKSSRPAGDASEQRRQSWDYAEAHAPSYNSNTATAAAATCTPPTQSQAAPPGPSQQCRPSLVERHLQFGEEDTRRTLGM